MYVAPLICFVVAAHSHVLVLLFGSTIHVKVDKILSKAGKHYGENIIKEYSKKLTKELGKGYSNRKLWLMLNFYLLNAKVQTLSAQLTWSHYVELLSINDVNIINYYISICESQNLSVRQLRERILSREFMTNNY